ncbi:UDP-N-acetylmuramoyl-L-alanyl-D-glutamate synthetase [Paenibacillus darwinianus]|uniref:UDP-N-acetylmuramoylalanine--D-glutamate ligase n=1 Tax=Paenibacillus darwinianus TaxID=1380763 RepID=A0A9W5S3U2_9BACL|nr:UDP-N-acetylmuramoyl-L-alanine--D-glutamate ligase [Paenibacillus darwinianus]EXX91691.1 UDP-N-acetylmuramoyl-L-alanyl-D-glutamate synthetase [Paenibacillus darwinianus]EXX92593.1 UDP-N-acetylmuramoyl-L-alanyl-D-glutamate synthetase [Paenibacillus darwinianus]EXX92683.1 UDP-N-acetylmuramoyl-L-alanyl-D-glutamate synthetase [Paenibacillus darwinianus]
MNHPESYKGQRVVVLGLARSGVSVAKVFHGIGAEVVVNDRKDRESSPEASELETLGITVICGGHPEGLITADTALLVKNPGIPYTVEPIARASELGVEIVTEVEVAYWLSPAPIIGITGSNGKTTTTTWTGELLRAAGLKPIIAGNIGTPLCEAAIAAEPDNWLVAELSSFQLKGTNAFRPRVAVLLNLAETHLDYHGGMDDYVASKAKLFANLTEVDTAVLNWDDAVCRQLADSVKAKLLPFSLKHKLAEGVCVEPPFRDGETEAEAPARMIVWRRAEGGTEIVRVDELGIPGKHNAANALAAIAASLAAGADPAALAAPLRDFRGVEHRLEFVAVKNDVRYYNDSKATNPTATTMSVRSLQGRIVLLAGGLDRGSDYMELLPLFKERVAAVVAVGETRAKIAKVAELAGLRSVKTVDPLEDAETTLRQAVREAALLAQPGDIVLLSPACASWDMFESYEQRGRIFKQSAHTL